MTDASNTPGGGEPNPMSPPLSDLGQVAAELVHDLSAGLGALSSRIALTREDVRVGRASVEDLDRLHRECRRLRTMLLDVLSELQGSTRSPEVTSPVVEVVEEGIERWLSGAPSVTTHLEGELSRETQVRGPRSFLDRIVQNLLRNAGRHAQSRVRVGLRLSGDGESALLEVEDDGEGLDPAASEELFQPFVRGAHGNVGLGLSVVRWACHRLGGEVTAGRSHHLGGARFKVRLPIHDGSTYLRPRSGSSSEVRERPLGRDSALAGLRIMVVDDQANLRQLYQRLLRRSGARPLLLNPEAYEGPEAVAREVVSAAPDVVLIDVSLGAMDGRDVWRHLRASAPALESAVFFLTGAPGADPHLPEEGAPEVLNKLSDWSDLSRRIAAAVPRENREDVRDP